MGDSMKTLPESLRRACPRVVVVATLALVGALPLTLPAQTATEYKAKAALLFNFIKFVRWPETADAIRSDFVIAVPASSPFGTGLGSLNGKRVQGRTVRLVTYSDSQFPFPCDVLIVGLATWDKLSDAVRDELRDRHVLSVGEEAEFIDHGGVLSLFLVNEHLAFDINVAAARATELEISANLLNLAHSHRKKDSR
jgi:hypothetical protein